MWEREILPTPTIAILILLIEMNSFHHQAARHQLHRPNTTKYN